MNKEISANANLSHYCIVSKIGAGGMGEVYLAQDTKLDRRVALKILPADVASNRDRMERFIREAKSAAALSHPNIAQIFEIGEHEGTHFIAMEFVDGSTLRDKIHRERTELRKLLRYLQHVAEGLAKAHAAGIVHRDLKPDNIMVTRDGHAKILDFGLAKLIEPRLAETGEGDNLDEAATAILQQQSTPGVIMGTVGYMSPEQAQGKTNEIDQRSDIFSFGCILFEAATRHKPFKGDSVIKSLHKVIYEPASLIKDFNPAAPADLQRIIRRCLAKDPEERYQTIKDVVIELKELRRELETGADFDTTVPSTSTERALSTDSGSTIEATAATAGSLPPTVSSAEYVAQGLKRHKLGAALALVILIGAVALLGYRYFTSSSGQINSIAVLPFANATGDKETEFLSDGISETLINNFTKIPELKVTARSTAFRFRGREGEPKEVGRELGVGSVLTGKLLQRGDSVSIQVDLVNTSDGLQIWGNRYEGKVSEIVSIQQRIATDVSSQLKLKLTGAQTQQMSKTYTQNAEAYQAYLRGRYYWNKRTAEDIKKAVQEFQQAADKDPNYALAYVGLADCYVLLEEYEGTPSSESLPRAKAFALRALQIDDSLGEAHATLGLINHYSWQWAEAEKEFKRAIELNPNYPTVHHWYHINLRDTGRFDEALSEIKRAKELDPLSIIINLNVGILGMVKGDPNSAVEQNKKTIEFDPNYWGGHFYLGMAYLKQGRNEEALAELQKSVEMTNRSSRSVGFVGYTYGIMGKRNEALAIIKELEDKYAKREGIGQHVAAVYSGLGDREQALAWLEKDFQAHSGELIKIKWYPPFEPLHSDPRFKDLLRRIGLPE